MNGRPAQQLRVLPGRFTIEHDVPMPSDDSWLTLVRAPEGLTVIRRLTGDDAGAEAWIGFYGGDTAHGLDLPGMLAALVGPLADAAVPVFVASTFHADVVLVPEHLRSVATKALRGNGHEVLDEA